MKPGITIEYCPKCGWLLRACYMAQEFLTSFLDDIDSVRLVPSEISGRYTISVNDEIVFDRKREGGFIEIGRLKQIVRDCVNPSKSLGHADRQ